MKLLVQKLEQASDSNSRAIQALLEVLKQRIQEPLTMTSPVDFRLSGQLASLLADSGDADNLLAEANAFWDMAVGLFDDLPDPELKRVGNMTASQVVIDLCRALSGLAEEREERLHLLRLRNDRIHEQLEELE